MCDHLSVDDADFVGEDVEVDAPVGECRGIESLVFSLLSLLCQGLRMRHESLDDHALFTVGVCSHDVHRWGVIW
jgi:hypothetical protein